MPCKSIGLVTEETDGYSGGVTMKMFVGVLTTIAVSLKQQFQCCKI